MDGTATAGWLRPRVRSGQSVELLLELVLEELPPSDDPVELVPASPVPVSDLVKSGTLVPVGV
jgi:hypothetical protein